MKILHMLNSIEFSGAEIMLKIAAPIFEKKGFELHVLSTGIEVGEYADSLRNSGYIVHHIHFRKSIRYFYELYRFLKEGNFDIAHIHSERAFFWNSLIAKLANVRNIIRTVHSIFKFCGYLRFKRILQRSVAKNIFGVNFISIGPSVATLEKKVFFNNTILIPNWIDQKIFQPAKDENERNQIKSRLGITLTDKVIVSVGSCTDIKNHDDVIIALSEIIKEIKNICYIHIGDGPLQEREKELSVTLGVFDKIKFLGQIKNVRDSLIISDIFVMPSRYEGLPISALEAISCGVPAVVYNVEGLKDIVEDGENGMLVEPNPNAMAIAVKELIENEKLRKQMSIKSRERLLKCFNMQDSLDKLMKIYRGYRVV